MQILSVMPMIIKWKRYTDSKRSDYDNKDC